MDDKPTVERIRADIEAGQSTHAVRMARKLAGDCGSDDMLALSDVFIEHAIYAPTVDLWRRCADSRELDPRERTAFANALNGLASEHLSERRDEEAMELFLEALVLDPALDYIRRNVASMLVHRGDFEAALIELDQLLTNSPTDPQANQLIGVARYQSGDPELAVEPLELAFDAGLPDAGLWLLKAYAISGNSESSRRVLSRLAEDHLDRARSMIELELNEPGSPLQALRDDRASAKLLDQVFK